MSGYIIFKGYKLNIEDKLNIVYLLECSVFNMS